MTAQDLQRASTRILPHALPVGLAVVGALASRYAVPFAFRYSMSFLPLGVAVLLYLLYRHSGRRVLAAVRASKRLLVVSIVMGLLFSTFLVLGSWGVAENAGGFGIVHVLAIIANALPLSTLFVLLMTWLDRLSESMRTATTVAPFRYSWRRAAVVFAILLLCWLPIFLAAFPGFFCYDMGQGDYPEWWQLENDYLSSHQPVFHTLLLAAFLLPSMALTGSINAGIAVFVGLQALIIAAVLTFMVRIVRTSTGSRALEVASIVYLALDPLVSMFVMCTTKDTLFTAWAVLLAVLLYGRFSRPAESRRLSGLVAIGACMLLICLLRSNSLYAIVVLMPFLIAFETGRAARLWAAGICAIALVLFGVWTGPAATALGVNPSPVQRVNAFSLAAQQLAYTVENEDLTLTQREELLESDFGVFTNGDWQIATYMPQNADRARHNLYLISTENLIKLYLEFGLAYPKDYLHVFVEQTQAAWSPYAYSDVYRTGIYEDRETTVFAFLWEEPATSQSLAPWLLEPLGAFSTTLDVQNVPLLALLTSIAFYLWLFLLVAARALVTLDKRVILPCILFGLFALMALVGPCQISRYYLYLIFSLPLLVTFLVTARPPAAKAKEANAPDATKSSGDGAVNLAPSVAGDR